MKNNESANTRDNNVVIIIFKHVKTNINKMF
jgi:hypothetical protein